MSPTGGFYGKYGAPSFVESASNNLRKRMLTNNDPNQKSIEISSDENFYYDSSR